MESKNHRNQRNPERLIGYIKFYNIGRGFGFIITNGLGIDDPDSSTKSKYIELFFSYKDLPQDSEISQGDWVTFVYKKTWDEDNARDYAKTIRPFNYDDNDFSLVKKYTGEYSFISMEDKKGSIYRDIFCELACRFIDEGSISTRQHVFDTIFSSYTLGTSDLRARIISIFLWKSTLSVITNPEKNSIVVRDREPYQMILSDLSITLFKHDNSDGFSQCICLLRDIELDKVRSFLKSTYENNNCQHRYFFQRIPVECFDKLLNPLSFYLSPELRLLIYSRKGTVSILFHKSVIETWNKALENNKALPFEWTVSPNGKTRFDLKRLGVYIASEPTSSDQLLLLAFIYTNVTGCLERICDLSICHTWLPRQSDMRCSAFFKCCHLLPEEQLKKAVNTIGLSRAAKLGLLRYENLKGFLSRMAIQLKATTNIISEHHDSKGRWCGGHFTWGEGMQGEEYVIDEYLVKEFSYKLYVNAAQSMMISPCPIDLRETLNKHIINCIMNDVKETFFVCWVHEYERLLKITFDSDDNKEYIWLFSREKEQGRKLLSSF